jgi:hypothetical protein
VILLDRSGPRSRMGAVPLTAPGSRRENATDNTKQRPTKRLVVEGRRGIPFLGSFAGARSLSEVIRMGAAALGIKRLSFLVGGGVLKPRRTKLDLQ